MTLSIETEGLTRRYGSVRAVDGIDLQVPEGSVFGFLGPNGSGKTTTLRMILGLISPNKGRVRMNGYDLHRNRSKALTGVGAIIEQPALYPSLTGRETLSMACTLLGHSKNLIDPVLDVVGLTHAQHRKVKGYSLGMRQRLALGRALIGNPRTLILDEPTNGLDPSGIAEMRALVKSLPERFGTTVLLSSHLLAEVEQIADNCALIKQGKLVFQGPLKDLKDQAGATLRIETTHPVRVVEALVEKGLKPHAEGDWVSAICDWDRETRAAFLSSLTGEGVAISHYELRDAQLESLFLQLTGTGA